MFNLRSLCSLYSFCNVSHSPPILNFVLIRPVDEILFIALCCYKYYPTSATVTRGYYESSLLIESTAPDRFQSTIYNQLQPYIIHNFYTKIKYAFY
jgi:hypothetical protein